MRRAAIRRSENSAVELLVGQPCLRSFCDLASLAIERLSLPVAVQFDSYAGYCGRTGLRRAQLCPGGKDLPSGMTLRHAGQYLILYDEGEGDGCRHRFTLAHEIGHILLGHAGEDRTVEEQEANAFAASLLCPAAVVYYLEYQEGRQYDAAALCRVFPLSHQAAEYRLASLRRAPRAGGLSTAETALLLQLFGRVGAFPVSGGAPEA